MDSHTLLSKPKIFQFLDSLISLSNGKFFPNLLQRMSKSHIRTSIVCTFVYKSQTTCEVQLIVTVLANDWDCTFCRDMCQKSNKVAHSHVHT